jgi:hypothetical protein
MAIVISILFLIGISISMRASSSQAIWKCPREKVHSQQGFSALCMDIWTKIDLVQAINKNEELKKQVLEELNKGIYRLYRATNKLKRRMHRSRCNGQEIDPYRLILSIRDALETVFKNSESPFLIDSQVLLNRMIDELITPVDIDAYVTT